MATLRRDAEFTTYVQARRPWLRRIAYLLCHDWHRADDLTQAAFLRLYLNWGRAQRAENLDAYVRRILVNVFLNEQRSSWWRRTSHLQVDVDEITRSPTDEVDGAIDLVVALAQIPPRQRAALLLRPLGRRDGRTARLLRRHRQEPEFARARRPARGPGRHPNPVRPDHHPAVKPDHPAVKPDQGEPDHDQ
jgi:RNA polymerase sigma factor (sigma-70 family)